MLDVYIFPDLQGTTHRSSEGIDAVNQEHRVAMTPRDEERVVEIGNGRGADREAQNNDLRLRT